MNWLTATLLAQEGPTRHCASSRRRIYVGWQGKLKRGAMGYVCRGPQPALVGFDDRTADREAHTHPAGFGGEEGSEQPIRVLGGDSDTAVLHRHLNLVCFVVL